MRAGTNVLRVLARAVVVCRSISSSLEAQLMHLLTVHEHFASPLAELGVDSLGLMRISSELHAVYPDTLTLTLTRTRTRTRTLNTNPLT